MRREAGTGGADETNLFFVQAARDFIAQIRLGHGVAWADKRPGDLIFFGYPGAGRPHHVAIYLGGQKILQAPRTGEDVRYGTIGEFAGQVMTVRRIR